MTINDYQIGAAKSAVYPKSAKVIYPALGLAGEAGEVANKVKKIIRDDGGLVTGVRKRQIRQEIGGVLWYCDQLCTDLGLNLGDVARENLEILTDRQERGKIQGDGDER